MKALATALAATLTFALSAPALSAPARSSEASPAAGAETTLDHVSVIRMGEAGSPVILIPGLATPREVWSGFVSDLARNHRVYLVQVNGFAGDAPAGNLAGPVLPGVEGDIHALIERDRLQGAAVIGHSLGGLVSLMLTRDHPDDVGRLMIVDALPFFGVLAAPPGSSPTAQSVEPAARAMRDAVAATYGKPVDPAITARQTAGMALQPEARAKLAAWAPRADARVVAQAVFEDMTTDLRPDLARVTAPVTLVYPWAEGRYTSEQTRGFYAGQYTGTPHLSLVEVRDAAHFVMLDQPAAFAAALDAFLR